LDTMNLSEPPLLKSKIPYIGHLIGFLRHQTSYLEILKLFFSCYITFSWLTIEPSERRKAIYTLPILSKKIYIVTSPDLIRKVFRSKSLSFEPFMLEFSQRLLGVSDEVMEPTRRRPKDAKEPCFVQQIIKEIHTSLTGEALDQLNLATLNSFAVIFNDTDDSFGIDSLYTWLRSILTTATTDSLFGSHNPMRTDPNLMDSYWYVSSFSFSQFFID